MTTDYSRLKRNRHSIPGFVKKALQDKKLMKDYLSRPAYQQNDYIGWINQAKLEATKQKRLNQMLTELKQGGVYMKMPHKASAKKIMSQYITQKSYKKVLKQGRVKAALRSAFTRRLPNRSVAVMEHQC